jgi:hypothetical protein
MFVVDSKFGFLAVFRERTKRSVLLVFAGLMLPLLAVSASESTQDAEASQARPHVIYGLVEQVYVPALGIRLPAKVDTGAESASLSATDIVRFKRDNKKWVRFKLAVEGLPETKFELPLAHNVRIRRRASDFDKGEEKDYARRAVVELELCIGDRKALLDVNLADRRRFSQPMLLGQDGLRALAALVDVNAEGAMGSPACEGANTAIGPGQKSESQKEK